MKGTLIKQHRKFNNMTLEELADGICSVSYLSKIEHDSISASDEIYRLLEERLNIKLVDINDEFDEDIYQDLLDWHEAAQLQDTELMEEYDEKYESGLTENQNTDLNHLYKIAKSRHDMKFSVQPLPEEKIRELENLLPHSNNEYKFFFHKTLGIHYILKNDLKMALKHFTSNYKLLEKVPFEDNETFFHLCMTYSKLRSPVESNYYGEKALEGYKNDMNYSRIIDTYMMIAVNYRYLNIHHIAEEYFLKLLKIGKNHFNSEELRRTYHNLGYINANQEKFEEAFEFLKKAIQIKTPDNFFYISTLYLLASTSYYCNKLDDCWMYIKKGEKETKKHDLLFFKHEFYILKNTINQSTREEDFIKKLEQEVIPDMRKLHEFEQYKNYLEMLGDIYYEKRMYKKAASCYKEANTFKFTQKKDLL
ncbi:helix-turn-helix domain-containing protein [Halobacillus locisalis]|uniref:Helix-turn-helix domain-containing protein n=1 Tax=Halobacillus locisalis TaxID=220753 RepID=A0A838CTD8_9BACI|nr:helix-turn-helix domain-containing protein [Halobacillus locisalis]MBA2175079.1 helix-turn-helix domain-containing protein [Halobacillus locisalis]